MIFQSITKNTNNGVEWFDEEVASLLIQPNLIQEIHLPRRMIAEGIYFGENVWDFTSFNGSKYEDWFYKFDFSNITLPYKNYMKLMVMKNLFIHDNKFSTVKPKFIKVRKFIAWLEDRKIRYVESLNLDLIKSFIHDLNLPSEHSLKENKAAVREFLYEIESKNKSIYFDQVFEFLEEIDDSALRAEKEEGKRPLIHRDIHNKIISLALNDLHNLELKRLDRMVACMIVIIAETGMRMGEFRILEVGKLRELSIESEEEVFYYLEFLTYKTTPEIDGRWTLTFMTPNAVIAYNTLIELTKRLREKTFSKFLYLSSNGDKYKTRNSLNLQHKNFFLKHQNDLGFQDLTEEERQHYKYIIVSEKTLKTYANGYLKLKRKDIGRKIYYVTLHQYRVTCATILYDKGYKLDWIRQHMNHLSDAMTAHYIRLRDLEKKKQKLSNALKLRANTDGKNLETNIENVEDEYLKEELQNEEFKKDYETINKFLKRLSKKKRSLNIFTDVDEIIDYLIMTKTPIVETDLGFCTANSLIKLCERQEYISSINDGYYIGPHIASLESLSFNYRRFTEKIKVLEHNRMLFEKDKRYRNEYELEHNGMRIFLSERLLPDLNLLEKEISNLGNKYVIERYKELSHIVENLEKIKKEILKWKEKTSRI